MQKNRVEIAGYLAAGPTLRYLPSGTPVANVRLGESSRYQDNEGKWQQHTNWHSLSFYGDLSRLAMTLDKGDNVFIEGSIEQRQFTPKDGVRRTVQEIVVRGCFLIAPPRPSNGKTVVDGASHAEEPPIPDSDQGDAHQDGWPIG